MKCFTIAISLVFGTIEQRLQGMVATIVRKSFKAKVEKIMRISFLSGLFFVGAIASAAEITLVDGSKIACTNENLYSVIEVINTQAKAQAEAYVSAGWPIVFYHGYVQNQSGMSVLRIQIEASNHFVGESKTVEAIIQNSAGCVIVPAAEDVFVKN